MEINRLENANAIPWEQLRTHLSKFLVPQMYYFIEDSELLAYLENNLVPDGNVVTHTYDNYKRYDLQKSEYMFEYQLTLYKKQVIISLILVKGGFLCRMKT